MAAEGGASGVGRGVVAVVGVTARGAGLAAVGSGVGAVTGSAAGDRASSSFTVSASFSRCFSSGPFTASSQWGVLMKYSIDFDGTTESMRKGTIATSRWTARSTSRRTCGLALALEEKISTMMRLPAMASMIASPHS